MDIKQTARKWALQNAVKYNGQAEIGAVIGKLISENPSVKKELGKLMQQIKEIIADINTLPAEQQKQEMEK